MNFLAILPLFAIACFVYALHRGLGMNGAWVQWKSRDISSLLTGKSGALVDRAFYLCGAGLILGGFVLAGPTWPAALYGLGGAALIGAALSRAVWPDQDVHVACALLAFAGIAAGNSAVAFLAHYWPLFWFSSIPILVIATWRSADEAWAHGFEWIAAGCTLAATAALLIVRLFR